MTAPDPLDALLSGSLVPAMSPGFTDRIVAEAQRPGRPRLAPPPRRHLRRWTRRSLWTAAVAVNLLLASAVAAAITGAGIMPASIVAATHRVIEQIRPHVPLLHHHSREHVVVHHHRPAVPVAEPRPAPVRAPAAVRAPAPPALDQTFEQRAQALAGAGPRPFLDRPQRAFERPRQERFDRIAGDRPRFGTTRQGARPLLDHPFRPEARGAFRQPEPGFGNGRRAGAMGQGLRAPQERRRDDQAWQDGRRAPGVNRFNEGPGDRFARPDRFGQGDGFGQYRRFGQGNRFGQGYRFGPDNGFGQGDRFGRSNRFDALHRFGARDHFGPRTRFGYRGFRGARGRFRRG